MKALVLDLRNNPGGLLDQAVAISSDFVEQGEIVSIRARRPEDAQRWDSRGKDIIGGMPLIVLINGGSPPPRRLSLVHCRITIEQCSLARTASAKARCRP